MCCCVYECVPGCISVNGVCVSLWVCEYTGVCVCFSVSLDVFRFSVKGQRARNMRGEMIPFSCLAALCEIHSHIFVRITRNAPGIRVHDFHPKFWSNDKLDDFFSAVSVKYY